VPFDNIRTSVTNDEELSARARAIIDANRYMTLGTADASGVPWVSPVWFATEDYRAFFWVSDPEARHSRNVTRRPRIGVVIFDSQVPVGDAQAVYLAADAEQLTGEELERGIEVFSRRSEAQGLARWTRADVLPPARPRLYRATVAEHSVLGPGDRRLPVRIE
jgi:nitroimidazol reductase NimA-like FMN-containing flavoprotein (pyridoxamine 5'-phosphate oxidase superfamily)